MDRCPAGTLFGRDALAGVLDWQRADADRSSGGTLASRAWIRKVPAARRADGPAGIGMQHRRELLLRMVGLEGARSVDRRSGKADAGAPALSVRRHRVGRLFQHADRDAVSASR